MMTSRTPFGPALAIALAGLLTAGALAPAAAEYPEETIRIVVPWRAGGGTDSIARALAVPMEEIGGQSVLVENITGGAGNAGMMAVKNAAPDGYTLLLNGSSDVTAPIVFRDAPYALADYKCVGGIYDTPVWIVASKERGYDSFSDLVKEAKANPGSVTIGVTAINAPDDVMAKALAKKYGIDVRIIAFDGGASVVKALLGDQINAGTLIAPVMLNEVKSGAADVLVAGDSLKNINYEPVQDTETLAAHGLDMKITLVRGVFVPKDVPDEKVAEIEALVGEAARSDSFRKFGDNFGFAPVWIPAGEYCEFMEAEGEVYRSMKE